MEAGAFALGYPGRFAQPGTPPPLLGRSHPVGRVESRVLSVRFTGESFEHSDRALSSPDSSVAVLGGASVARAGFELAYGLGRGLMVRTRFGGASFNPGVHDITAVGGAPRDRRAIGFEDLTLAVDGVASSRRGRLAACLEAGMICPTGNDQAYDNGSGLIWTPFTIARRAPFAGAGATLALSRPGAPVAIHLHSEGTFIARRDPPLGRGFTPFPERFALVVLGNEAFDLLDLRFALAFSRPSGHVFAEVDLPLLLGAGSVITVGEAPLTVTPGFALRAGALELGAQADLSVAGDDASTTFDPHRVYPEWAFRFRLAIDLVPFDRDRDRDGIGDRSDRCPDQPEDRDGYQDRDGCPDPDDDGDLIPDVADACPQVAEDRDGFEDADGCPDLDNDKDGIPDAVDLCPSSPEDMNGVDDGDGCPEIEPQKENAEPASPNPNPDTVPRPEEMR